MIGVLIDPSRDGAEVTELRTFAGDKQARVELRDYAVSDAEVLGTLSADDLAWTANAFLALQCMEMVGGEPGNLFSELCSFVAVDGDDQLHRHVVLFRRILRAGHDPIDHIVEGKPFRAAQGNGRETQFHVFHVVFCRILDGFTRDSVNNFGRTVK